MEHATQIKMAVAAFAGALTGLWGWMGWLILGWIGCMVLDYLSGTMAAAKQGQWASSKAREGIWHKAGMVIVVVVAAGADLLISAVLAYLPVKALPVDYSGLVCPVVLCWYIVTELGSVAENAAALGAPVPAWLTRLLALGESAIDKAGEEITGTHDGEDD